MARASSLSSQHRVQAAPPGSELEQRQGTVALAEPGGGTVEDPDVVVGIRGRRGIVTVMAEVSDSVKAFFREFEEASNRYEGARSAAQFSDPRGMFKRAGCARR